MEKREVRHCNWVRFLRASTNMNDVNVIARRVNKRPQFQVIKPLPVNAELKVSSLFILVILLIVLGTVDWVTGKASGLRISHQRFRVLQRSSVEPGLIWSNLKIGRLHKRRKFRDYATVALLSGF